MSLLPDLHRAIRDSEEDTVHRLVKRGADVNALYNRETAFTAAINAECFHIAATIMTYSNFNPNAVNQFDRSPLYFAAKDGQPDLVKHLLRLGAKTDIPDVRGVTPLGACAWHNSHESAKLMIEYGANVNQLDVNGETPLYRACLNVSLDVIKILLENGADVNISTNKRASRGGHTPLMASVPTRYELEVRRKKMSDMIAAMKLIISHGCDLNAVNDRGKTALHLAVDSNEIFGACLLAENGCSLEVHDGEGLTPFQAALKPENPRYELALYLLLYGCNANPRMRDPDSSKNILPLSLVLKTKPEKSDVMRHRKQLLFALIPATNLSGNNIIEVLETVMASLPVSTEDVEILRDFNVNLPRSLQSQCRRVIRNILGKNIMKKVEVLPTSWRLKQYLSFDFDFKRFHPLSTCEFHTSVKETNLEKIKLLLQKGIYVNIPLKDRTPLTLAVQCGHMNIVNLLLCHGADPTILDHGGQTALHIAAKHAKNDLIPILIKAGGDVNRRNSDENSPMLEAALSGHFDTVIYLLKNGADTSILGSAGTSIIHLAAGTGHKMAVERILNDGVDPNSLDSMGNTPLHVASTRGVLYMEKNIRLPGLYKDEVLELMDAVKRRLSTECTTLSRADNVHHVEVIQLMLENGCDPHIQNNESKTAFDLATNCGFHEAALLLRVA